MVKHFRVFGDLVVTDENGNGHHPAGRQAQILAILLAAHPDSVTSGRLIDEVWGESPPKDPDSALHNAVSRLRHMVGADLVTTPTGYALNPTILDFERFDQAVEAARRSSRLEDYESAIRLWAGDPFRGYEDHPTVAHQGPFGAVDGGYVYGILGDALGAQPSSVRIRKPVPHGERSVEHSPRWPTTDAALVSCAPSGRTGPDSPHPPAPCAGR